MKQETTQEGGGTEDDVPRRGERHLGNREATADRHSLDRLCMRL